MSLIGDQSLWMQDLMTRDTHGTAIRNRAENEQLVSLILSIFPTFSLQFCPVLLQSYTTAKYFNATSISTIPHTITGGMM